jgi:hypothetical protein
MVDLLYFKIIGVAKSTSLGDVRRSVIYYVIRKIIFINNYTQNHYIVNILGSISIITLNLSKGNILIDN